MSADSAIIAWADRLAKGRQNTLSAFTGGTDFWSIVDAAADETFENLVKGQAMTDLDTALEAASIGSLPKIASAIGYIRSYLTTGLSYTGNGFNGYLDAKRFRVPYEFAETVYDALNARIDPQFVFPKGTWAANIGANATAGLHKFGDVTRGASSWPSTLLNASGALPSTVTGAPVIVVSNAGAGATAFTVNTVNQSGAAKAIALTAQSLTANTQVIVGAQAITGSSAAGTAVDINMAATGQFTALEWALFIDDDVLAGTRNAEVFKVNSITANTKLVADKLIGTWAAASVNAKVVPLYTNVTGMSAFTGGSENDAIQVYARPDRAIAL